MTGKRVSTIISVIVGVALIFGIGAAGATAAASFELGRMNKAASTSTLASKSGAPLALRAAKGQPPLRVNSSVEVDRLNAAEVGGVAPQALQRVMTGSCPAGIASLAGDGAPSCVSDQIVFTESATWSVPAGVHALDLSVIGGGGGGAAATRTVLAGGGGGGSSLTAAVHVQPGERLDFVIGQAGRGGSGGVSASGGTATIVYREAGSGAMLVKAGGGRAGATKARPKHQSSRAATSCPGGSGGAPVMAPGGGATGLVASDGMPGGCTSGGGATGFAGAGGKPGSKGAAGHAGESGLVVVTLVG